MNIQALLDALSDASARDRSKYHLTLGALIGELENSAGSDLVRFDDGSYVGREDSYRGYYEDLAFSASKDPSSVSEMLSRCRGALGQSYEGYKGGEYRMTEETPLWRGEYGCCGPAIVDVRREDGVLVLVTKDVD